MTARTSSRASALAEELAAVNEAILETVGNCSDEQWQRQTASERWPVGVVAHHVSEVQGFFAGVLSGIATGESHVLSLSSQDIDENNANHARQYARVSQSETVAALREQGAALVAAVAGLDDAHLGTAAFGVDGQEMTAEQIVEFGAIGHFREHLASIQATIAG